MSKVTVMADGDGNVIIPTENPEYGYVRVEQFGTQVDGEGWLRVVKKSALIKGKMEDLLSQGYYDGQQIDGKIVVKESLKPFYDEDPDRNLKMAGDTGVVCRLDDQPIYRQSFYTTNLNAQDELIMHTNRDEIRNTMSVQKSKFKLVRDRKMTTASESKTKQTVKL